jgi:membrane dipeptidase
MLYKLVDNGGIIGLNYEKRFLHDDIEKGKQTITRVIEHARYIKQKIGIESISLGSDFDGIENDIELDNATKLPLLIQAFSKAGFTDEDIEKIAYKNALRVFETCL